MLNQKLSISDIDRPEISSTALSPLPSRDGVWAIDTNLKARLLRAAAASGLPLPDVIPGAAVLLQPIDLPLNTDRKRRGAAPFAMEPYLAAGLDQTHVAVGPALHGSVHLCAAAEASALQSLIPTDTGAGAVLPDLCAVPLPTTAASWALWCGQTAIYVRTHGGGGCVVDTDRFADLWRGLDRPALEVWHGTPPPGVAVARHNRDVPEVDPSVFDLDLRPTRASTRAAWAGRVGFAIGLSVVAGIAHAAVLFADARALERTATDRRVDVVQQASARGAQIDFDLPTAVLTQDLLRRATSTRAPDPFLTLLARTGAALSGGDGVAFRDLRFDASTGTLTILISAPDLDALQQAETALRSNGLGATGGAASTSASGAEMQLTISGAI